MTHGLQPEIAVLVHELDPGVGQASAVHWSPSSQSAATKQQPAAASCTTHVLATHVEVWQALGAVQSASAEQQSAIGKKLHESAPGDEHVFVVHALLSSQSPLVMQHSKMGSLEQTPAVQVATVHGSSAQSPATEHVNTVVVVAVTLVVVNVTVVVVPVTDVVVDVTGAAVETSSWPTRPISTVAIPLAMDSTRIATSDPAIGPARVRQRCKHTGICRMLVSLRLTSLRLTHFLECLCHCG
jgi:hypothetical protein